MSEKENKIHNVWDKFKLKKDLPTWKAWEEMWIWEDGCLYAVTKDWDVIMVYHVNTLLNFKILNSKRFEKIEKEKSIFELGIWDGFYSIDERGHINNFKTHYLELFIENWNVFLTKEGAEAELERRKAIQRVKKFMWENNIKNKEFKWGEHNYAIFYNNLDKIFYIEYYEFCYTINDLWFLKTYEDCEKIIDNCLEDLKIIYNIKD